MSSKMQPKDRIANSNKLLKQYNVFIQKMQTNQGVIPFYIPLINCLKIFKIINNHIGFQSEICDASSDINEINKLDGDIISKIEKPSNFSGTLVFKIDSLPETSSNGHGTLHAVAQTFFMEYCATMAVMIIDPDLRPMHVGSSFSIDYINPCNMDYKLFLECNVIKTGRNMANVEVVITEQKTGKYICRCSYTKVFQPLPKAVKMPKAKM